MNILITAESDDDLGVIFTVRVFGLKVSEILYVSVTHPQTPVKTGGPRSRWEQYLHTCTTSISRITAKFSLSRSLNRPREVALMKAMLALFEISPKLVENILI